MLWGEATCSARKRESSNLQEQRNPARNLRPYLVSFFWVPFAMTPSLQTLYIYTRVLENLQRCGIYKDGNSYNAISYVFAHLKVLQE